MEKVGIIGAGKIGGSLLVRLAESEGFDLAAIDIHPEQLEPYRGYGVRTTSSNRELAEWSDLVRFEIIPLVGSAEAATRALNPDAASSG